MDTTINLTTVIEGLVEERGLARDVLNDIVCEGMFAAYEKKYPETPLRVQFNKKTGELAIEVEKEVVSTVEDDDAQISSRKAKNINSKNAVGDKIWLPFDGKIGRVEILKAKQVIAQKLREVEARVVYDAFKDKEGTIVLGSVHKCERSGTLVTLQDTAAFLPRSLSLPNEHCVPGHPIRALLKEVLLEPRGENQLILDRASGDFLKGLFELEIPEVFEEIVEIKGVARRAGYKSKVVVASNDSNIDPVGTCVGVGGARIKPILRELDSEKIDVIPWNESSDVLVKNALKPAEINRVDIEGDTARVWLDEDQRALAIGKMGQNIQLASQVTGYTIELVDSVKSGASVEDVIVVEDDE